MPVLEEILDTDARRAGGNNIGLEPRKSRAREQDEYPIPEGMPGNAPQRKRGRPKGSTSTNKSSVNTSVPSLTVSTWERITAITLNWGSAIVALRFVGDGKYTMTQYEAECAAKGLVVWMFQYKQIRDLAIMTDFGGPTGAVVKGFMPYISRVFIREFITNVLSGQPLSQSIRARKPKTQQSRTQFNGGVTGTEPRTAPAAGPLFSNNGGDGSSNGHTSESTTPRFLVEDNWRNDG